MRDTCPCRAGELLEGKDINYPPAAKQASVTFKKAARAEGEMAEQTDLFDKLAA